MFEKFRLLELNAEHAAGELLIAGNVGPEDGDAARRRGPEADNHLDGRCFAGPVRAEEPENLALFDAKRHAAHGFELAVGLAEIDHGERGDVA